LGHTGNEITGAALLKSRQNEYCEKNIE